MSFELFGTRATTLASERDGATTACLVRREGHFRKGQVGIRASDWESDKEARLRGEKRAGKSQ